jgi:hypothetical protein
MVAEVYRAFRAANVPENEAQAAATAVAEHDQDIADLRRDVLELRHEMKERFAKIEGELWSYRWMFGIIITMQLAIMLLLLRPALTA